MADPKGFLVVPVGFRADGTIHALELDTSDRLKVLVDAITGSVIVTQTTPANLLTGIHGWDGDSWEKVRIHQEGAISVANHPEEFWRETDHIQIFASGNANNAEVTIYTVPAAKRGFITSMTLSVQNVGAGVTTGQFRIYDAVPALVHSWLMDVNTTNLMSVAPSFTVPIYLQAGWTVRAYSPNANVYSKISIHGFTDTA